MHYLSQDKPPVAGEEQRDPTHSAVYGIMLAERLKAVGVEVVVVYAGSATPEHPSINAFLIAKLKP